MAPRAAQPKLAISIGLDDAIGNGGAIPACVLELSDERVQELNNHRLKAVGLAGD